MTRNRLSFGLLTHAKVTAMSSKFIQMHSPKRRYSLRLAYFDNIHGQLKKSSRSCHGIFVIFLLPCLTKSLIIANPSQNFASESTFIRLANTVD